MDLGRERGKSSFLPPPRSLPSSFWYSATVVPPPGGVRAATVQRMVVLFGHCPRLQGRKRGKEGYPFRQRVGERRRGARELSDMDKRKGREKAGLVIDACLPLLCLVVLCLQPQHTQRRPFPLLPRNVALTQQPGSFRSRSLKVHQEEEEEEAP